MAGFFSFSPVLPLEPWKRRPHAFLFQVGVDHHVFFLFAHSPPLVGDGAEGRIDVRRGAPPCLVLLLSLFAQIELLIDVPVFFFFFPSLLRAGQVARINKLFSCSPFNKDVETARPFFFSPTFFSCVVHVQWSVEELLFRPPLPSLTFFFPAPQCKRRVLLLSFAFFF